MYQNILLRNPPKNLMTKKEYTIDQIIEILEITLENAIGENKKGPIRKCLEILRGYKDKTINSKENREETNKFSFKEVLSKTAEGTRLKQDDDEIIERENILASLSKHINYIREIFKDDAMKEAKQEGYSFLFYILGNEFNDKYRTWNHYSWRTEWSPYRFELNELTNRKEYKELIKEVEKCGLECKLAIDQDEDYTENFFALTIRGW